MTRPLYSTHPDIEELWNRDEPLPRGYGIAVMLAALLLAAVWSGGDARFSAPAFSTLRTLGGRPLVCGAMAAIVVALLVARCAGPRMMAWTLYIAGGVYLLFAISFFVSALASPVAALTGPAAYLALAAFHISHAVEYSPRWRRP